MAVSPVRRRGEANGHDERIDEEVSLVGNPTYKQSDIEAVYRRGDWHSWGDILDWMQQRMSEDEQADNELSEQESRELLADVRHLHEKGADFPQGDPAKAYKQLQGVH